MGRDWKKWAMDKGLQKWFRRDNFLILVLTEEKKEQEDSPVLETEKQTEENSKTNNRDSQEQSGQTADADAFYAARMEERLTQALSRVAGVGEVQVMITLKASSELVVEKEQPVRRSSTNESDAMGGNRIVSEVTSEENVIYRSDGSLSEPYVVKTLPPQIEGVLVIAEGAGNGTVSRTIVEIAQALFDVEAHKVKVVPMEEAAP